jgi:hypothetical protein
MEKDIWGEIDWDLNNAADEKAESILRKAFIGGIIATTIGGAYLGVVSTPSIEEQVNAKIVEEEKKFDDIVEASKSIKLIPGKYNAEREKQIYIESKRTVLQKTAELNDKFEKAARGTVGGFGGLMVSSACLAVASEKLEKPLAKAIYKRRKLKLKKQKIDKEI